MIAVGTDILQINRIEEMVARQGERFVRRILTEQEQQEYHASKQASRLLAKRFAAKEAIAKSLGTGIGRGVSWQDIQIEHDANGAPIVRLLGGAMLAARQRGGERVELSLSDEMDYVIAFAVLDK
ncbi:MAG: holo-ACP synthase [Halioglobus sp.]|nr:holo-ACP synthase [Halioglobus sp.]